MIQYTQSTESCNYNDKGDYNFDDEVLQGDYTFDDDCDYTFDSVGTDGAGQGPISLFALSIPFSSQSS